MLPLLVVLAVAAPAQGVLAEPLATGAANGSHAVQHGRRPSFEEWRSTVVYQVGGRRRGTLGGAATHAAPHPALLPVQLMTDRFARSPLNTTTRPNCVPDRTHCSGTWQGVLSKLHYITACGEGVGRRSWRPGHAARQAALMRAHALPPPAPRRP